MLRKIYFWSAFTTLVWLCTNCGGPSMVRPLPEPGGEDTTGIDTSVVTDPDTLIVDTLPIVNRDSAFAFSNRFGTINIFTEADLVKKSGVYYKANDFIGRPVTLDYSFISAAKDTMQHRPFVLMVHEGAFLFGTLDNEMGKATWLARKGYAAASINYRLGFNGGSEQNACGGNNREVVQAVYRAVQDTYAALHYFAGKADELNIDPAQMILAGSSAGAITISALLYMREADFEALLPGIVKTLGPLDPNPKGAPYRVRALLSYMGYGIFKSSYINAANAKPTVFFQRTGDNVLPYQKGTFLSCPFYLSSEGAKPVSDQLRRLKVAFELNYQPEKGHHLSYTEEYVTNRYAQFMKRLWAGNRHQVVNENFKTVEDIEIK
ncbi:alpha/beta hydrolase [Dyadobacter sp. CY343]|uniref:carboxylesterase family protein n=1 Tax=Dyadobacter sp. CY343 TaxID=2907299 RepID=UPI001F3BEF3B|nr:alpha/beta hydrolase [Dyadobacter sp. CY343]MCE7059328.1 alpha/beta hydrolase [Dyadobacter sp. CY343]